MLATQWALCDRTYERVTQGKSTGVASLDLYLPHLELAGPLFRNEHADALANWRRAAEWAAQEPAMRSALPEYERFWLATDELGSAVLGVTTDLGDARLAEIEDRAALLRLALRARRDGAAAAIAESGTVRTPSRSDPPLARTLADGVLELIYADHSLVRGGVRAPDRVVRVRTER